MEKKTNCRRPATLLVLAGSDPCGGAGLQADIRVATALDCYAMGAVTALTSQNSCGVIDVWPLDS
ncbi:MAG: bifunctional hydroxymethylpyrimidine kinase/phosphomethylpyrimidine kinase, partial [Bacteroidaceae bacterium]